MSLLTLDNVVAHALQMVVLAALGTLVARVVHIDSAAVRYGYWRLLLAACLLLPFVLPGGSATASSVTIEIASAGATAATDVQGTLAAESATNWTRVVTAILVAGMVLRFLWVGAGVLCLRRLRGLGRSARDEEDVHELQMTLGTTADVRYVSGLRQPATFGVRRPVVLLPERLREEEPPVRLALVTHELLHVQRRDWVWVLCEEVFLAIFWFNPAMWWLVARVRLTREEAVDELAVLATGSRRTYVRALLAYAEDAPLAPAPAFAHRRHLFHRLTLISKEGAMSSFRIVFSCAAMALVLALGSWYAADAFPLVAIGDAQEVREQAGPMELRAKLVTAEHPIPRRTDYRAADYPDAARTLGISGTVTLRITLDEVGRVAEARRVAFSIESANPRLSMTFANTSRAAVIEAIERGSANLDAPAVIRAMDALAQSAVHAVGQWRYE